MPPQDQPPLPPAGPPVQQPGQSYQPDQPGSPPPAPHPADYDFILNPATPSKGSFLKGADSTVRRLAMLLAGLLVLVIIAVVLKNLLAGKPKLDSMVTVAQAQQELIHLAGNANQQQDLSAANQNLVATVQLSVSSAQSQIITYLSNNHFKLSAKTLSLGVSNSVDQQLNNAASAGTYNQTLQDVMRTQLGTYLNDMKVAYNQITGPKGRALLRSDYQQAQLLLNELSTPAPAGP